MVKGKTKKVVKGKTHKKLQWVPGAACTVCGVVTEKIEDCCSHLKAKFGLPLKTEEKEKVCTVCGNIAKNESEYCDHQKGIKKPEPTEQRTPAQPELGGMPPKGEETLIAEDILDQRDHLKSEREKLKALVTKFASQMHLIQKSKLLVKGWNFEVDMIDKVTITKKK